MRYGIGQDYEYVGHDYWKWRSWLVSENGALDAVTQVEWFLHPTFPTSRIVCTDRERRFLLETAGWGTFELRANVHLVTGEVVKLSHRLVLEYPPDSDVSGTEQAPSKRVAKNLPDCGRRTAKASSVECMEIFKRIPTAASVVIREEPP